MGLANWVVGKMVDSFLAQPPEEKARVFDTMATKFWEAATPEEVAQISKLLLPRFMEHFLGTATAEQKLQMVRGLFDPATFQGLAKDELPALVGEAVKAMTPEQWLEILPKGMPGMPGMPGAPKPKRPGQGPGGMMPW